LLNFKNLHFHGKEKKEEEEIESSRNSRPDNLGAGFSLELTKGFTKMKIFCIIKKL